MLLSALFCPFTQSPIVNFKSSEIEQRICYIALVASAKKEMQLEENWISSFIKLSLADDITRRVGKDCIII